MLEVYFEIYNPVIKSLLSLNETIRLFEWNSCFLFSPKGESENNCALQYASYVIGKASSNLF